MVVGKNHLNQIKTLHLSHALDEKDGGISSAVNQLFIAQKHNAMSVEWIASNSFLPFNRDISLINKIIKSNPSILHVHGLWRSQTRIIPKIHRRHYSSIIAPHGMLDSWALSQSKFRKKMVWNIWEKQALNQANCIQALCIEEANSIEKLLPGKPIAVIPNGVEIPEIKPKDNRPNLPEGWSKNIKEEDSVMLFFGRFHKKKGIYELLKAWKELKDLAAQEKWWLCLVGYGDSQSINNEIKKLSISRCLQLGPAFGKRKSDILSSSSAFILPSYSEGLPISALEAMSFKLPCILSKNCNLPDAFEAGAAICTSTNIVDITESIKKIILLDTNKTKEMGLKGRELVTKNYNWSEISRKTNQLYEWINLKTEIPGFVYI